jgi:HEAT repeat protein
MHRFAITLMTIMLAAAGAADAAVQNGQVVALPISSNLETTVRSVGNGWVAWDVPLSRQNQTICCWNWSDERSPRMGGTCKLDIQGGFSMSNEEEATTGTRTLLIFTLVKDRRINNVRLFTSDCNVDAKGARVHQIASVNPAESVALLRSLVRSDSDKISENALAGIGLHDTPEAIPALEGFTRHQDPELRGKAAFWLVQVAGARGFETVRKLVWNDPDREVQEKSVFALTQGERTAAMSALEEVIRKHPVESTREDAVFWLGQTGGVKAMPMLIALLENRKESSEVKEKAVFAISQVDGDESTRALVSLAKKHPELEVRKKAIFWLGQKAGEHITATLRSTIDDDPDSELREMAVFAISQRPRDEAVPMLIELAKTHRDPEVRKKALFWLGQSEDPRAVELLEKILLQ